MILAKIGRLLMHASVISLVICCQREQKKSDKFVHDSMLSDSIILSYPKNMRKIDDFIHSRAYNLLPYDIGLERMKLINMYFNDDDSTAIFVTLYNTKLNQSDSIKFFDSVQKSDSALFKSYVNFKPNPIKKISLDGNFFIQREFTNDNFSDTLKYRHYQIQLSGSFQNRLLAITYMTFRIHRSDLTINDAHEFLSTIKIK